ncbi:unnamed protein product [Heterobilharzia americana]|nr:unnamed protein product [Heterobilharzia americana]
MVYLDTDSEIKEFTSVLDPSSTDGILVAGDDNLLQKAVTGLLCRDDFRTSTIWMMPVGVVPLGIWNGFINTFCERKAAPKWCYNSLHPVLQQSSKRRNILEVKVISDENQQVERSKEYSATTYSLLGIEWNIWRDIELGGGYGASGKRAKPIGTNDHRGVLTTLSISSPRTWTRNFGAFYRSSWYWFRSSNDTSIPVYHATENPSESSSNYQLLVLFEMLEEKLMSYKGPDLEETKKSKSLLGRMFGFSLRNNNPTVEQLKRKQLEVQKQMEEKSIIHNPECEEEREFKIQDSAGLKITPEGDHIRLDVYHRPTSYWDHIRQFHSWLLSQPYTFNSGSQTVLCDKVCLFPIESENEFYWIDNDYFEARPIEVSVRPEAINLFM